MIGGDGCINESDETNLGIRKYNRGRLETGGFDGDSKEFFIEPVEFHNANTLLAVIKRHIAIGTMIYSDYCKSYNSLEQEAYQHLTVNHSVKVVDPDIGANTQQIEQVQCCLEIRKDKSQLVFVSCFFFLNGSMNSVILHYYKVNVPAAEDDRFINLNDHIDTLYVPVTVHR